MPVLHVDGQYVLVVGEGAEVLCEFAGKQTAFEAGPQECQDPFPAALW
ncbi:hypothetical protein PYK79_01410 [Streptomyces sp. ID05-04B]|nr:hypothetical protein [Streptomyces sp. ID05-04B]MDX5562697.1 hypothetical protein [Streptomyces sp. ID05-04B]